MRSNHIRSNVIGYVALFLFAMSGTAAALDGSNTVFCDDIVNGEVMTADLADDAVNEPTRSRTAPSVPTTSATTQIQLDVADDSVTGADVLDGTSARRPRRRPRSARTRSRTARSTSAKVLDDSQAGGGLGPQDLATNAVAQAEIATDGVAATEVQNDSIDAGEIVDFGLTNQDVGVLFAEVSATGVLDNHSGGVTVTKIGAAGTGQYEVDFGRNIALCTAVATIGLAGAGAPVAGEVYVADRSGNAEAVFVDTNTSAGAAADRAFRLVVVC